MRCFRVRVGPADEEPASAVLWEAGTLGVEVRPTARIASLDAPWPENASAAEREPRDLVAYFPDSTTSEELRGLLPGAAVEEMAVPDVDWVARFREGFRAFQAGRFRIVPVWEEETASPDRLVVDPGRAFGTGTHETTRLCLAALEHLASRRPLGRTLDLGTGTGILAIAARHLGARPVIASDVDAEATASARLHAGLNGARLALVRADGGGAFRPGAFDLVLANLMALLLIDRAAEIRSLVAPGGALVLSGLLREDARQVAESFGSCGTPSQLEDGEWAALVYERTP